MKIVPLASFGLFLLAVGCGSSAPDTASNPDGKPAPGATFASVQGVLSAKCAGCHGAENPKGGVALDTFESVMKGGHDGPVVEPGDPAGSELVAVMRGAEGHKTMPPKGPPVAEDDIKKVEDWIQAGAKA